MGIFRSPAKLAILVLSLLLLYAVLGFFVLPWVAESTLPAILSEQLDRPVTIGDIAVNPFEISFSVHEFAVRERDGGPLFGFQDLVVNVQAVSLIRQAYVFEEVRVTLPYGLIHIRPDGTVNVADLGSSTTDGDVEGADDVNEASDDDELPVIEIRQLAIDQGMVEFHDDSQGTPFTADIVPITIALNQFTTRPATENPYAVTAELGEGETIDWEGTLVLEPFSSTGTIQLTHVRLRTVWEYLQDHVAFEIANGFLDVSGDYQFAMAGETADMQFTRGELTVHGLDVLPKGGGLSVITIPALQVEGVGVDAQTRKVRIPTVRSQDAQLSMWLEPDGALNYQRLFSGDGGDDGPVEDIAASDAGTDDAPWVVNVEDIAIQNYGVTFEDRTTDIPVRMDISGTDLTVQGVDTTFAQPLNLSVATTLNQTGTLKAEGSIGVTPVAVDLDLEFSAIDLTPFQPYLSPFVQFEVMRGALDLEGAVHYRGEEGARPSIRFDGRAALADAALTDLDASEEFLRWASLAVDGLALELEPINVTIRTIGLSQPFVKAAIAEDGTLNLARVFRAPDASEGDDPSASDAEDEEDVAGEPAPVKIDEVRVDKLALAFEDRSLRPHVLTGLQEFSGTINGLSSEQVTKADVDLKGKVGQYAPLRIKGKINPLSQDAYTDIVLALTNFDLNVVSPYSGKYVGHPITKGKLSLDLAYKVAEQFLEGENKILVDQITMGPKVESPDATSLPVPLALALLKDRHGKIDVDLPVRGDLNDPDFSYGGVILDALINLLTKIVTSPFNLLGGVLEAVGVGGDDLQQVGFEVGNMQLNEDEQDKLDALAQALHERPALRLEVQGTVDHQADRRQLAEIELARRLDRAAPRPTAGRVEDAATDVETPEPTDPNDPNESGEQRAERVRALFIQQFGEDAVLTLTQTLASEASKNTGASAAESGEPDSADAAMSSNVPADALVAGMRQQLLETIEVKDSRLRLLAQRRARQIRDYLVQEGKLEESRVFLVEVQLNGQANEGRVPTPLTLTGG